MKTAILLTFALLIIVPAAYAQDYWLPTPAPETVNTTTNVQAVADEWKADIECITLCVQASPFVMRGAYVEAAKAIPRLQGVWHAVANGVIFIYIGWRALAEIKSWGKGKIKRGGKQEVEVSVEVEHVGGRR